MKKMLVSVTCLCMFCLFLSGCGKKEQEGPTVRVSISTAGTLQLAAAEVTVKDADGDSVCTVLEALQSAHDSFGSEDKPFKTEDTEYGKSITSVWGDENGMSGYGVWLNNGMLMDLTSAVSEGDYIYVYSYADLETWADSYAYFDRVSCEAENREATLSLTVMTMDENWNYLENPLAGAVITVNGEDTDQVTDETGKVSLSFDKAGEYVISAHGDAWVLVPPVALVTVK